MNYLKGNNKIEKSTELIAFNFIENSIIGNNCKIFGSIIKNCVIDDGVIITNSVLKNSVIKSGATIGPFSFLRANSFVSKNCRIGDFVEMKNSYLGEGSKVAHHSYIGDAYVGANCNIGCGTVFANYNGKTKQKIYIDDNVFVGANVNLVAPLVIEKNCFIAAGTTIRKNLPKNTFVVDVTNNKQKPIKK